MMKLIPPRLRVAVKMAVFGAVAVAVAVAIHGWVSVLVVGPFVIVAAVGYYVWAGRESDLAAVIRHQTDERQAYRQLKMQALVGKVMSVAAAIAYLVAFGVKATLWPFAIFVALPALALFAGSVIYRERDDRQDGGMDITHA